MDWSNLNRDPGVPDERLWTTGRLISLVVVGVYLFVTGMVGEAADVFDVALVCAIPLFCIWAPEILARYEGLGSFQSGPILRPSHAKFVYALGWISLLLPAVMVWIIFRGVASG